MKHDLRLALRRGTMAVGKSGIIKPLLLGYLPRVPLVWSPAGPVFDRRY